MSASVELAPCPFCGSSELGLNRPSDQRTGPHWHDWFIRCYQCHVETAEYQTEAEAVAAWNTRLASQEPATVGEDVVDYERKSVARHEVVMAKLGEVRAALSVAQLVPDGWKMVPVKPTEAMIEAFGDAAGFDYDGSIMDGWAAMISAVPASGEEG